MIRNVPSTPPPSAQYARTKNWQTAYTGRRQSAASCYTWADRVQGPKISRRIQMLPSIKTGVGSAAGRCAEKKSRIFCNDIRPEPAGVMFSGNTRVRCWPGAGWIWPKRYGLINRSGLSLAFHSISLAVSPGFRRPVAWFPALPIALHCLLPCLACCPAVPFLCPRFAAARKQRATKNSHKRNSLN